jgi:hypothetical protein
MTGSEDVCIIVEAMALVAECGMESPGAASIDARITNERPQIGGAEITGGSNDKRLIEGIGGSRRATGTPPLANPLFMIPSLQDPLSANARFTSGEADGSYMVTINVVSPTTRSASYR